MEAPLAIEGACMDGIGCVGWELLRSRLSLICWDGGGGGSSRCFGGDERERNRLPKKLLFLSLSFSFPLMVFFDVERAKGM